MSGFADIGPLQSSPGHDIGPLQSGGSGGTQTLVPAGVASQQAVGTPELSYTQDVAPDSVDPQRAVGTPSVAGGNQTVSPVGVTTNRAFGVPIVAGPVIPVGVASRQAVGTPGVKANQVVAPDGVASQQAVGVVDVRHVQAVFPNGVASRQAVGSPQISGGPQSVVLQGQGINRRAVGIPRVTGGRNGVEFIVGGVEMAYSRHLEEFQLRIQSQTIGRWNLTGRLVDKTGGVIYPRMGSTCLVQEFGQKRFAGCIQEVQGDRELSSDVLHYGLTAVDKSGILDHRIVKPSSYTADQDGADVIRDLASKWLGGEGITLNNVPLTLGALGSDLPLLTLPTVRNAFDQVATLTATVWWIDVDGDCHFSKLDHLDAAPVSFTENSKNWRKLSWRETAIDYRTTQYVVSNLNTVPTGINGISGYARAETITLPQAEAQARGFTLGAFVLAFPALAITSFKVNGVDKPIFAIGDTNPGAQPWSTMWFYFPGGTGMYIAAPIEGPDLPHTGDVVTISYITGAQNAGVEVGTALAPVDGSGNPLGTCGSGNYEVVEQVKDVDDQASLNNLAASILARKGGIPILLTVETDVPGFAPGQLLTVDIPKARLGSRTFLVTQVTGVLMGTKDLGHRSAFRWTIQGTTLLDPGNWVNYLQRLFQRSETPAPLPRYETVTFISPAGSALTGGTSITNPSPVENTGPMTELWYCASEDLADQAIVFQLRAGGNQIGQLTVPPGTLKNTLVTFDYPATAPQYVFRKDVLSLDVSFQVTGPNPAPISGITFKAIHRY